MISLVQVWATHVDSNPDNNPISATSPSPVTPGNTLIIMLGLYIGSGTDLPNLNSVSDDVGDIPSEIFTLYALSGGFGNTPSGVSMWHVENAVGGTTTVSATATFSPEMMLIIAEVTPCTYTGQSSVAVSSDPGGFGLDHIASGPISANANDYIATMGFDTNDLHSWTVSSGTIEHNETDSRGLTLAFADYISGGGTENVTWTSPITSFGIPMYAGIAAFSEAANAGNRNRAFII